MLRFCFVALGVGVIFAAFPQHPAKKGSGSGIKCSLTQVKDSERSGLVAYTYFLPDGWKNQSNFNWTGNTFVASFDRSTADNQYEVLSGEPSNMSFTAATNTQAKGTRFTKALDYLHFVVDHFAQNGKMSNVQTVVEYDQDLPLTEGQTMMQNMRSTPSMTNSFFHQTAFLKVSFELDGKQETASLGTTMIGNMGANHMSIGYGRTASSFDSEGDFYVVGPTLLVITPAQPSASRVREAQLIASSTRITPQFSLYVAKLAAALSQSQLNGTIQRGKQQIQDMREQTAKSNASFRSRMADRDASTHDFCNYLLDQQDYKTSGGSIVTLPSAYNHAWADDQGHYVLTDDPTFDPHGTGGGNWEQMAKSVHGQ